MSDYGQNYEDGYVLEYLIPVKKGIRIRNVKVNVECSECHNRWGVYILPDGSLPYKWEVCNVCSKRVDDKNFKSGGYVSNEYNNVK